MSETFRPIQVRLTTTRYLHVKTSTMDALAESLLENFNRDTFLYLLRLVEESVDTNDNGILHDFSTSIILKACQVNNIDCLNLMIECAAECFTADVMKMLLQESIVWKSWMCAEVIIDMITDVNLCSVISWFTSSKFHTETFHRLIKRGFKFSKCPCGGSRALLSAILSDDKNIVDACLVNGCTAFLTSNESCETEDDNSVSKHEPITVAICNKNGEIVRLLLQHGAKLSQENEISEIAMSPLCLATSIGDCEIVKVILEVYNDQIAQENASSDDYNHDVLNALTSLMPLEICAEWKSCFNHLLQARMKSINNDDGREVDNYSLLVLSVEHNNRFALLSLLQNGGSFRNRESDIVSDIQCATCDNDVGNNNHNNNNINNPPVCDPANNKPNNISQISNISTDSHPHRDHVEQKFSLPSQISSLSSLNDDIIDISLKAGVNVNIDELDSDDKKRVTSSRRGMSLVDWSRVTVRRHLTNQTTPVVASLPIPQILTKFINFKAIV